ncbi:hypothetical protein CQJ94_13335 [Glycomyces fuscus]|nr:hypothetical protein CQJ94_13335 [Glycomyces fuscus]
MELDQLEGPVRRAFEEFLRKNGLYGTDEPVLGMSFINGGLHFAVKALEFVPQGVRVVLVGANLSDAETDYLSAAGHLVFNHPLNFDNELMYEMLTDGTSGDFGWVDADCFVLDPSLWSELLDGMDDTTSAHAAFTYEPLGFAKTPLVMWSRHVRKPLADAGTTLNSYAQVPTNAGRISPYAISRVAGQQQLDTLGDVLGREDDGSLTPHDGLLDIYANGRTVNSRNRAGALGWFGPDVERTGWLIDTPILAEAVLRRNGLRTRRLSEGNRQITDRIIHVGASGYRQRMRNEGASTEYLARFRLTDLFEVLLADELSERGLSEHYAELSALQAEQLEKEAGIAPGEIRQYAQSMLRDQGLDLAKLGGDRRMGFLF